MATTTRTIEKGIRELTYKNKDGSSSVKYQVRIHTQELPNFNVLLDSLAVAREIVANAKSSAGRELIKSLKIKFNEPKKKKLTKESLIETFNSVKFDVDQAVTEVLKEEDLKTMLEAWFNREIKKPDINEVDKKNNQTYLGVIKSISSTYVNDWFEYNRLFDLAPINLKAQLQPKKIKIGDVSIFQLTAESWNDYIKARLAVGRKKSTLARELSIVSSMYNSLKSFGTRYKEIPNLIDSEIKKKVRVKFQKREIRITEDFEEKLINSLKQSRNIDMLYIFQLALYTGARRSEILFWEWNNVKLEENYYFQQRTKNSQSRKIPLNAKAKEVISKIKKVKGQERIFTYTIEGFKSNWARARDRAGLKGIQFRDTRNEYISRGMENTDNPVVTAKMAGIKNQAYFNQTHLTPHLVNQHLQGKSNTALDVQRAAGHLTAQMTHEYIRLDFSNLDKQSDEDISYQIEKLKLKVKYGKATDEEKNYLLKLLIE